MYKIKKKTLKLSTKCEEITGFKLFTLNISVWSDTPWIFQKGNYDILKVTGPLRLLRGTQVCFWYLMSINFSTGAVSTQLPLWEVIL